MTISFVAQSTATNSGGGGGFEIGMPAGTEEGMVLVAFVTSTTRLDEDVPDGWIVFEHNDTGESFSSRFLGGLVKVAGPGETGPYEFVAAGVHDSAGGIRTYSGVDPDAPINASVFQLEGSAVGSLVVPSITTTKPRCVLLGSAGGHANATWTSPMSEHWDLLTSNPDRVNNATASEELGAAGATGSRTFTPDLSTSCAGILCALAPARGWHVGYVGT